jgi:hypothetical protein
MTIERAAKASEHFAITSRASRLTLSAHAGIAARSAIRAIARRMHFIFGSFIIAACCARQTCSAIFPSDIFRSKATRHLISARTHRAFRAAAMNVWGEAVAVA